MLRVMPKLDLTGADFFLTNRAWDLGEEKDKEVHKFPLNRGDNKPRRCEQYF